jgi:aryl-alcohol dehydrogenase-like predicted oxidoreductase
MRTSMPGRLGRSTSVIGLGCWQLGADWGDVDDDVAQAILGAAADAGTTFFDTADVYGDGRSEKAIGRFLASRDDAEHLIVATKMGRRADPHVPEAYTLDNFRAWTDRSRDNLGVDRLDLVQLHCPPTPVFSDPRTYEDLATLVSEGRVENVGVSVETVQEALVALGEPGITSIQIIINLFRRKPLERVLAEARAAGVMVIARVPLASGLLSGRYDETTVFPENDHRNYNRSGAAFDVGETFAGVPFAVGIEAAREVAALTPEGWTTAQMALRWILDQNVDTVIPGARTVEQAVTNAAVGDLPSLSDEKHAALAEIYNRDIRGHVHGRW